MLKSIVKNEKLGFQLFHGDSRFRCPYDFCYFIAACAALESWHARRAATAAALPSPLP